MDETYKNKFFDLFMDKFLNDIEYLDDNNFYKILWSFIKAGRFSK